MTRVSRLLLLAASFLPGMAFAQQSPLLYTINLNDRADELFKVTLAVNGLTPDNAVYQFASTAPGTYQVMNVGRFVRSFQAFDGRGRRVPVDHVSINQWRLSDAPRVRTIKYSVAETWESQLDHPIYLMCGTSLESDHALINPQGVIGYPSGMQATPVRLRLSYPARWRIGTALDRAKDGTYLAKDYDQLVDSPILLGPLTSAETRVTGVPVTIYTYSKTGKITSPQLLASMNGMLQAAGKFLGTLPVPRYTFLYHFGDKSAGAWEHSLSSEYVLQESEFTDSVGKVVTDIASHEFFHVVTPLNIHSEIIEHFNFVTPVPSEHLWLYEGTTEWAAHMMQLRAGLKTPEAYLATIIRKMNIDRSAFDSTYSLKELALTSYSDSGQAQYGNIYMRGALTAGLLDIRLLELSHGQRGLRNLILDLAHRYGKRRAFPESTFVDTLVALTDPSVRDFFDNYVMSAHHLPVKEYYEKLGIHLIEDEKGNTVRFDIDPKPSPEQLLLREAWLGRKPRVVAPIAAHAQTLPPVEHQKLAREIFKELVEINTTEAKGSTPAAQALAARFRAAGFPDSDVVLLGPRPDHQNLVVRYRGDGSASAKPILFIAHLDVVEARPEDWSLDPFTLTERDGYFYGRGSSDIKDEVADLASNFLRLKREGFVPARDLMLAFTEDEEGGDFNGAAWLVANRRDLVDAAYVINLDAAGGQLKNGKHLRNPVQTSEKVYVTYTLEVVNPGGHSSMPVPDNAIYRLAAGLGRLARFDFPLRLNETTRAFFQTISKQEPGQVGADLLAITRRKPDPQAVRRLGASPFYHAMMRNTCVATMLRAGHAENALPQRAQATVQCRLLPGEEPDRIRETLRRVVSDSQITVTIANEPKPSPASPVDPEVMEPVRRITSDMWPGAVVLPVMDPWSTDGLHFRRAGIPVYGVSAVFIDVDDTRAHGRDERVGVEEFYEGVEFMYRLIQELGGGRKP